MDPEWIESMHYEIVSERGDAVTTLIISRFTQKQLISAYILN